MFSTTVSLICAVALLVFGIWVHGRNKDLAALYIGVGFGLFALSHLLNLVGLQSSLEPLIIVIRLGGYGLVGYALYMMMRSKPRKK
ncbi:MAG: hypothetical protein FJ022_07935 [Chloroflexi bacterium]|nr:hypothetical protein [Chloroflexota bacterium]MBM3173712.1 hypothetical protein [Chloroflexota bacterium]MBM4450701.1 hypothetical protein [Chloroflexota bacterium]MBM4453422.1 hypothetical protein [Chloroflexota bacterium]